MKLEEIRSLAQIMKDTGLTGLEILEKDLKIKLEKRPSSIPEATAVSGGVPAALQEKSAGITAKPQNIPQYREIKSPMVGVFYSSPTPESDPYVKVGSRVKKGDIICVIEAMKLLNEINSDQDGEIAEICVENGMVVEYGQTLFKLR